MVEQPAQWRHSVHYPFSLDIKSQTCRGESCRQAEKTDRLLQLGKFLTSIIVRRFPSAMYSSNRYVTRRLTSYP